MKLEHFFARIVHDAQELVTTDGEKALSQAIERQPTTTTLVWVAVHYALVHIQADVVLPHLHISRNAPGGNEIATRMEIYIKYLVVALNVQGDSYISVVRHLSTSLLGKGLH
jgi:hypothetical protein